MNKLVGLCALLAAFVLLLGTVVTAQDAPQKGKGFGGGAFGNPLTPITAEAFITKYDKNKDGKVTGAEYTEVAAADAKAAWEKIDSKKTGSVDAAAYTKYLEDNPIPAFGGGGKKGGKKGGAPVDK